MNKIATILSGTYKYRSLLLELVVRDIKVRYRRSLLGLLWTILNPILMMIIMTIVFSNVFRFEIEHFPIYFFSGNILFSYMTEVTTNALYSIVGNSSLIKKVYIPKYLFPISKIISGLVNMFFAFIAMICIMLVTNVPVFPTILISPIIILYVVIFSTGLGLILSTAMAFFGDVAHLYGVANLAWMYLTPIFYPPSLLEDKLSIALACNPMYHFITMMREVVLYGTFPSLHEHIICLLTSSIILLIGLIIFYRKQDSFILHI